MGMRTILFAMAILGIVQPALAACYTSGVGDVPTQLAAQTAQLLCQEEELKAMGDAQFRQLQLDAQLHQQQILLEQQLKFEQQMAAFTAAATP